MPTLRFRLEKGGVKRLTLSYKGYFKGVTVAMDGNTILTVPDQKQLEGGESCSMPDGSTLRISLAKRKLIVTRNGVPVPGSATDPETLVKTAAVVLFVAAAGSVLLGIIMLLFIGGSEFGSDASDTLIQVSAGAVLGVLGYFVWHQSTVALGAAIALFAIYILFALLGALQGAGRLLLGLPVTIGALVVMIQALSALRRRGESAPDSTSAGNGEAPPRGLKVGDRIMTQAGAGTVQTITTAGQAIVALDQGGALAVTSTDTKASGAAADGEWTQATASNQRPCPSCGQMINLAANRCGYCWKTVTQRP